MGGVSIYKFSIHHVHICTRKKNKATMTEGNSTTPGIHGPQHEEGKYTHTWYSYGFKGPGVRWPWSCPCTYTDTVSHKHCTRHKRSPKYMESMRES